MTVKMSRNVYDDYYLRQAGHGMPIFVGGRYQRGRGLGNILGGLARMVIPVLKRSGKTLLKEGLRTGIDILGDVTSGRSIKSSAKQRIQQTGSRLLKKAVNSLPQPAPPGKPQTRNVRKRKARGRSNTRTKRRKRTAKDIFD